MSDKKVINYGLSIIDSSGDNVTHFVTSINIDNMLRTIHFIVEKGVKADIISISMEQAQSSGIINIQKLLPFIK